MARLIQRTVCLLGGVMLLVTSALLMVARRAPSEARWITFQTSSGIFRITPDGIGQKRLTSDADSFESWSPDHQWLITSTWSQLATINRVKLDGSVYETLIKQHFATFWSWSPDNEWIIFYVLRDGHSAIYRMRLDGSEQQNLTNNVPGNAMFIDWSPDNEWMLIKTTEDYEQAELFRIRPDGSEQHSIATVLNNYHFVAWSPDGEWLIFSMENNGDSDLYRIRLDGTGFSQLTNETGKEIFLSWSPDGEWMVFHSARNDNETIYRMRPDGTNLRKLTDLPYGWSGMRFFDWSPDGQWMIAGNLKEIYRMRPDGSDSQKLVAQDRDINSTCRFDSWSPDKQWMIYGTYRNGNWDIYKMRPDGSDRQNLTNNPNHSEQFAGWSPDGEWMVYRRGDTTGGFDPLLLDDELCLMRFDGFQHHCLTDTPDNEVRFLGYSSPVDLPWRRWVNVGIGLALVGLAIISRGAT